MKNLTNIFNKHLFTLVLILILLSFAAMLICIVLDYKVTGVLTSIIFITSLVSLESITTNVEQL